MQYLKPVLQAHTHTDTQTHISGFIQFSRSFSFNFHASFDTDCVSSIIVIIIISSLIFPIKNCF